MRAHILVTGGAGYIGSHACKALAEAGFVPVAYDNLVYGHAWAVKWGPLVEGDIADRARIGEVIARYGIRAAMHFAAYAYVGESLREPGRYFRNNVAGSLALFDALVEARVPHLVFSSTCATYGLPERLPIDEEHPQHPVNPYGESKLFVERALKWYETAHGLRWVALRYFNAGGADPAGELGEDHDPETHLIPLAIQVALGAKKRLEVYGTDYPTGDGTAVRDYIHVSDIAAAHVAALEYLRGGQPSVAVNLGTGQGYSVREVVRQVERVAGTAVRTHDAPRRPGDPHVLVASSRRAAQLLGWRPRHSSLPTIVKTAWHWHSGELNGASLAGTPHGFHRRAARARSGG